MSAVLPEETHFCFTIENNIEEYIYYCNIGRIKLNETERARYNIGLFILILMLFALTFACSQEMRV